MDTKIVDVEDLAKHYSGSLQERYDVYAAQADAAGWDVMTFDEWLNR